MASPKNDNVDGSVDFDLSDPLAGILSDSDFSKSEISADHGKAGENGKSKQLPVAAVDNKKTVESASVAESIANKKTLGIITKEDKNSSYRTLDPEISGNENQSGNKAPEVGLKFKKKRLLDSLAFEASHADDTPTGHKHETEPNFPAKLSEPNTASLSGGQKSSAKFETSTIISRKEKTDDDDNVLSALGLDDDDSILPKENVLSSVTPRRRGSDFLSSLGFESESKSSTPKVGASKENKVFEKLESFNVSDQNATDKKKDKADVTFGDYVPSTTAPSTSRRLSAGMSMNSDDAPITQPRTSGSPRRSSDLSWLDNEEGSSKTADTSKSPVTVPTRPSTSVSRSRRAELLRELDDVPQKEVRFDDILINNRTVESNSRKYPASESVNLTEQHNQNVVLNSAGNSKLPWDVSDRPLKSSVNFQQQQPVISQHPPMFQHQQPVLQYQQPPLQQVAQTQPNTQQQFQLNSEISATLTALQKKLEGLEEDSKAFKSLLESSTVLHERQLEKMENDHKVQMQEIKSAAARAETRLLEELSSKTLALQDKSALSDISAQMLEEKSRVLQENSRIMEEKSRRWDDERRELLNHYLHRNDSVQQHLLEQQASLYTQASTAKQQNDATEILNKVKAQIDESLNPMEQQMNLYFSKTDTFLTEIRNKMEFQSLVSSVLPNNNNLSQNECQKCSQNQPIWREQDIEDVLKRSVQEERRERSMLTQRVSDLERNFSSSHSELASKMNSLLERTFQLEAPQVKEPDANRLIELEENLSKLIDKVHQESEQLLEWQKRLKTETTLLNEERQKVTREKEELTVLAQQVNARSNTIEQMCWNASRELDEARKVDERRATYPSVMSTIKKKEEMLHHEKEELKRERAHVRALTRANLCYKCHQTTLETSQVATSGISYREPHGMSDSSISNTEIHPAMQGPFIETNTAEQTSFLSNADPYLLSYGILANQDRISLQDETSYLESLITNESFSPNR